MILKEIPPILKIHRKWFDMNQSIYLGLLFSVKLLQQIRLTIAFYRLAIRITSAILQLTEKPPQ